MTDEADIDAFVRWFRSNEGFVDTNVMGITEFPGSGRGVIARCDIPEGYTLFSLPRTITLSTRTSPLPFLFGVDAWRAHGLNKGWVGLILCMMWEDAWAHESDVTDGGQGDVHTWGPYMRTLPTVFDTPMFWSAEELDELRGTSLIDKIGRDDAERAYTEQLIPAIKTSPALFPPTHYEKWYNLDAYHRAGSRILSRSFTVSRWAEEDKVQEDNDGNADSGGSEADDVDHSYPNTSIGSSMHVDDAHPDPTVLEDTDEGLASDSEGDQEDDPSDVAMVPMADLLNARWGSENAKLFYERIALRMVTTKIIKQGEQIFNTYGDPPNSDLLRRYGHVDLVRLDASLSTLTLADGLGDIEMNDGYTDPETTSHLGNPSDVVEIRADLVLRVVEAIDAGSKVKDVHARIEWWLDENEDDDFVLSLPEPGSHLSTILPSGLISLTRLLILSEPDFRSARTKGKLPKGKLRKDDVEDNKRVLEILDEVFKQREGMYIGGSVEDEERLLSLPETLTKRKRHAVIVRLGEKRILRDVRQILRAMLAEVSAVGGGGYGNEKDDTRGEQKGGSGGQEMHGSRKRVVHREDKDRGWKRARK